MDNVTKMSIYYESHSVCSVLQDDRNTKDTCNAKNNNLTI